MSLCIFCTGSFFLFKFYLSLFFGLCWYSSQTKSIKKRLFLPFFILASAFFSNTLVNYIVYNIFLEFTYEVF